MHRDPGWVKNAAGRALWHTPRVPEQPPPARPPKPVRRLAVVLSVAVGLGAGGTLFGLGVLASWGEPLPPPKPFPLPPPQPGAEALWAVLEDVMEKAPLEAQRVLAAHRPRLTALAVVDVVSSLVLLVGAFLARQRSPAGLATLSTGLVLSQGYAALELVVKVWFEADVFVALRGVVAPLSAESEEGRTMAVLMLAAQALVIAFVAALSLLELGFYVYASRLLRKPEVHQLLAPLPAED